MRNILLCLLCICFCLFHELSIGGEKNVWFSQELGIRFSYDKKWIEKASIQDSPVVSIEWFSKKSNIIATCYVEASESEFGSVIAEDIHNYTDIIGETYKNREQDRCYDYNQIALRKRYIDNYPVIYFHRSCETRELKKNLFSTTYSLITSFRGKEISFSCVSNITSDFPEYEKGMQEQLLKVLGTLQFDR